MSSTRRSEYSDSTLKATNRENRLLKGAINDVEKARKVISSDLEYRRRNINKSMASSLTVSCTNIGGSGKSSAESSPVGKDRLQLTPSPNSTYPKLTSASRSEQIVINQRVDKFLHPNPDRSHSNTPPSPQALTEQEVTPSKPKSKPDLAKQSGKHISGKQSGSQGLSGSSGSSSYRQPVVSQKVFNDLSKPKHTNTARAIRNKVKSENF